MAIFQY